MINISKIPDEVRGIINTLNANGFEAYIVGGAVRNIILEKVVYDWDFTTNATPEQILSVFKDSYYNNSFGTVGIESKDKDIKPHEVTTFRSEEGYSDFRRPDKVSWGKTIIEDLSRRDFTINAIALALEDNKVRIIDPFDGLKDIDKKIIRAVGEPSERFREDALRIMRAVRIGSELSFNIDKHTLEAICTHSPLIHRISKERVRDELLKTFGSPNPYFAANLMIQTKIMDEVLPEFVKTFGVEQKSPQRHHIYDVGTHSLLALKFCKSSDPIVRLATMIHDVGKPITYKKMKNGVITFYNHEIVGSRIALHIAKRLKFSKKDTEKLFLLVRYHQFTVDEKQTDSAIRRFIKNVKRENVEDMLSLRTADRLGGGATETSWRLEEFKKRIVEVQKQPFSIKDLKISGSEVMQILNIPQGPRVGEVLSFLFKSVEENNLTNSKEELIKLVKDKYSSLL